MKVVVIWDLNVVERYQSSDRYGDWSDTFDSFITDVFVEQLGNRPSWNSVEVDVPDDTSKVYIVKVTYSSGDTFGNSYGNLTVPAVFLTEEEANNYKDKVYKNEIISNDTIQGYILWDGYFERLEACSVEEWKVRK